ncbi:MAG: BspA family leucine-rich repeat surface protein, partial [Clostridia bacterium]|nr:BspA family leucine-rich repeat surface protein [Clostridia bacterium]
GLESFNTSSGTSFTRMFEGDALLLGTGGNTTLDLSGWNTSLITSMDRMFKGCSSVKCIDSSTWETGNVTTMASMFTNCTDLEHIDVSTWDFSKVTTIMANTAVTDGMFAGCSSLKEFIAPNKTTNKIKSVYGMFYNCTDLERVDLTGWNLGAATSSASMFSGCTSLETLILKDCAFTAASSISNMFYNCSSLTELDMTGSSFKSFVITANNVFDGCSSLEVIDMSSVVSTWQQTSNLFANCGKLKSIIIPHLASAKTAVGYLRGMFSGTNSLVYMDLDPNFYFIDGYNTPPTPVASSAGAYTGKWTYLDPTNHSSALTPTQLARTYKASMAGVWVAEVYGDGNPAHWHYVSVAENIIDPNDYIVDGEMDTEALAAAQSGYGEAGYWTIVDDNTWTYTFHVVDKSYLKFAWENTIEGYTGDYITSSPHSVTPTTQLITVTNVKIPMHEEHFGDLSISKTVTDYPGEDPYEGVFVFTVTLTDGGNPISGSAIYGSTPFTDGVAKVTVADGETVTFTGIPEGYSYSISEEPYVDFEIVAESNLSGTIVADTLISASVTNKYKNGVPPIPDTVLLGALTVFNYIEAPDPTV